MLHAHVSQLRISACGSEYPVREDRSFTNLTEHRERLAMEREWARRLNSSQLDSLQKVSDAEKFAAAKAAEAEQLAETESDLRRAAERIRSLEAAGQEQQAAVRRATQRGAALEAEAKVKLARLLQR